MSGGIVANPAAAGTDTSNKRAAVNERIDRWFELLVVWVLLASAVGLVSTLMGHFLAPQVWILSLLLVGVYAWRTRGRGVMLGLSPDWRHLLVLTLLCLFFRLPAYHYVLGSQDEGLYVNISHYIERTGGIDVRDTALDKLKGSPYTETYLANNRVGESFLPGVYAPSDRGGALEFQFYHLFPIWMALFIGLFGTEFGVYALTFFGWLSVIFFYRLALTVSGSRRVALVAGLLLALNPLHAFFSKFPVTEVPTLAFSLIGFTYLAAFWSFSKLPENRRLLWISGLCFGALFITRISGFMYLPFFLALAVSSVVMDSDPGRRKAISIWVLGVIVLYGLSVLYGLRWSSQYAAAIYELSFDRIFRNHWRAGITAIAAIGMLGWLLIAFLARSENGRKHMGNYLIRPGRQVVGIVLVLGIVIALLQIYRLGWTDHFSQDAWLSGRWGLAHSEALAVKSSSLFALIVYLGPFLPACFLALALRTKKDPRLEFLRLFAAGFFVYAVALLWNLPYGPYYARYLLSETVPYMILFAVLAWSAMSLGRWKRFIKWGFFLSLAYMSIASAAQLGKSENEGLYGNLKQLLTPVDSGDLILIDEAQSGYPTADEIKAPILYIFDDNIISVLNASLENRSYLAALDAHYDEIFLLSPSAKLPVGFESLGSTRIMNWAFKWSYLYPRRLELRGNKRLYLSRLIRPVLPLSVEQRFDSTGRWNNWLSSGWGDPEPWGTWSLGRHAELAIDPRQLPVPQSGLRLHFDVNVFVTEQHPRQRILVSLDGAPGEVYTVKFPGTTTEFDVDIPPAKLASARMIRIRFELPDAVSPQAVGLGIDRRPLALGLKTVTAAPIEAPSVPVTAIHD